MGVAAGRQSLKEPATVTEWASGLMKAKRTTCRRPPVRDGFDAADRVALI